MTITCFVFLYCGFERACLQIFPLWVTCKVASASDVNYTDVNFEDMMWKEMGMGGGGETVVLSSDWVRSHSSMGGEWLAVGLRV